MSFSEIGLTRMMTFSRRGFNTMSTSLLLAVATAYSSARSFSGNDLKREVFSQSGDDDLDRALIAELKRIVHLLEVNPGFKYVSEMNAFAENKTIVRGTKGTVYLGIPLIKKLMEENDGGIAVAGVCAHECGHVYQWDYGFWSRLEEIASSSSQNNVSPRELHADFIAGCYIGMRKGFSEEQVRAFSRATYELGDYQYRDVDHHGTPGQRSAAVEKGYKVAVDGATISTAAEIGLTYVAHL
jgi:hypothetical protein